MEWGGLLIDISALYSLSPVYIVRKKELEDHEIMWWKEPWFLVSSGGETLVHIGLCVREN